MRQYTIGAAVAFVLLIACSYAYSTTYYFSTTGSDANNGTSTSTPKKTIGAALNLMTGGNVILFKSGDIWYIHMDSLNLRNKSNFTIDAYGTGNKPVIAGMVLLTNPWVYTGSNNIWKNTDTRFHFVHRVFVNGVSRIDVARKAGNTNALSSLDATDEFYHAAGSGSTLYLKMTSSTVPPSNVEVVGSVGGNWGGVEVVQMRNTTNVTINNIEFRGGSTSVVILIEAPSSNITINNCIVGRCFADGIRAINKEINMNVVQNINITNCVVDKGWTTAENNVQSTLVLEGDGIIFNHGVNTGVISGNTVRNFGHDGIGLYAFSHATAIYGVKNIKIEQNDVSAGNSAYMHAVALVGPEGKMSNNIVKRNYFHHYSSGCTIGGDVNFVFGNIFSNVVVSPNLQQSQAPWAINMATWPLNGVNFVCKNNWISNNTFYNTDAYSILMDNFISDPQGVSGNKLINNIFMNFGRDTIYTCDPEHACPPRRIALRIQNSIPAGSVWIKNNNFWANYDTTASKIVALYKTNYYTAATLNGCAECVGGNSNSNVQLNPRFDLFFGLTANSSPTLRSGGNNYSANIIGWGLPASEFVDYFGTPWPSTPSIGAVQY